MDTIKVISKMDFKTYYRMGLRNFFYGRMWVLIAITVAIGQVTFWGADFKWSDELFVLAYILLMCGIIMPLTIYFNCRRNMKLPGCSGTLIYQLSNELIELKGDTIGTSSTWEHIKKATEFENYFVLTDKARSIHYLPKSGFESENDISMLKDMIRANSINAYFKNH